MNKEIILPVSELKAALPGFSKIIGKRTTLPVLQSVRLTRNDNGIVSIQATDLECFATYTVKEPQSGPAIEVLVALDQLNKTVKGLKSENTIGIVIEGKAKAKLRYAIGGSPVEQSLDTIPLEEWPPAPKVNQPAIPLEAGFGLALKQALQSSSDDPTRYILTGACLDVEDKKFHYVVGTNGRALFSANSFCFDLQKSVIIPDSKFLSWTDLLDEEGCSLSVEPGQEEQPAKNGKPKQDAIAGWVKFVSPRWTFITQEILGKYPNWKQVVPSTDSGKWTQITLSQEAIQQMLQIIPRLPGDYEPNHPIRIRTTAAGQVLLEGQGQGQEQETSIPVQNVTISGKPVEIGLNRQYLLRALHFNLNRIEIEDELTPLIFSQGGKKMVVMPIGPDRPTPVPRVPAPTVPPAKETTQSSNNETSNQRTDMSRTATTTIPATAHTATETAASESAIKKVVDQIEKIKDTLKEVVGQFGEVLTILKAAEKEKKATEKEIESIRATLRTIQNVRI